MQDEFKKVLRENPNGVLASRDGDKIRTRIFQYLFLEENKVYFCTSSDKKVYQQISAHPYVNFCIFARDFAPVLSLGGPAVFVEDRALKARALDENPAIKGIYKSADNPAFKIFYLKVEEIDTFSYARGSKNYKIA